MMKFISGSKIYVHYSADVVMPFGEWLTIEKYESGLLYFKEKPAYEAIDCNTASFYGYGYSLAGKTLVTEKKWHISFAAFAETIRRLLPVRSFRPTIRPVLPIGKYARLKPNNA